MCPISWDVAIPIPSGEGQNVVVGVAVAASALSQYLYLLVKVRTVELPYHPSWWCIEDDESQYLYLLVKVRTLSEENMSLLLLSASRNTYTFW